MAILDPYGNPIKPRDLDEPQTARMIELQRQWSSHPGRRLTPEQLKRVLDEAERGNIQAQAELFADIEEMDVHIAAEMGKRVLALADLEWDVLPPEDAGAAEQADAALAKSLIEQLPAFDALVADLATGIGYGFACAEITWQRDGNDWLPAAIELQQHDWFMIAPDRKTLLLRSTTPITWTDGTAVAGEPLQPFGWIVHTHRAKTGALARRGLHRALAWIYLLKQYALGDLAELLEIFGIPMRLGTYQPGASDAEKRTLLQAVLSIGHNAGGIIPEGMGITFAAAAQGNSDPFMAMVEYCDKSASKLITGGTLNTQADGQTSTNALGRVHADALTKLTASDAKQIGATLTRDWVYPLLQLNSRHPPALSRCPRLVFDTAEPEDIKVYADALPKLVTVMQVPTAWAHSRLKIPLPKDGEAVLQAASKPPLPAGEGRGEGEQKAAVATAAATVAPLDVDPSPTTDYTEQLAERGATTVQGWLEHIRGRVEQADSLEALRDDLLTMYGDLPDGDLANVMSMGLACADLVGRFDVQTEAQA